MELGLKVMDLRIIMKLGVMELIYIDIFLTPKIEAIQNTL